ncbi:MAG: TetR family transcriptional regulator [Balneolaceae bacterium]|nr:TetR family transcriptional regulator [Balneolaceae bacterium]
MIDLDQFDADAFQARYDIMEAAIPAYLEKGMDFTLKEVAREAGITVGEIFEYFPDKKSILEFYYTSLAVRYRLMLEEIDDFEEYSLGEKLSNLAYTTFDMMAEQEAFVQATFTELVLCARGRTDFGKEIRGLLRRMFENDDYIPYLNTMVLGGRFYGLLYRKYLALIRFWLGDESEGRQQTMELTDKTTALAEELMYSGAADRGVDLLRYLAGNSFFIDRIPLVRELRSKFEFRS